MNARSLPDPPAVVGMPVADVDTPALLVDLDALERNLDALARSLAGAPVRVRPHAKSHKCPEIARRQIARGAVGVCCQKVSEAETLVHHGIGDVFIVNEIVGASKLDRLARLAGEARLGVTVDDEHNIDAVSRAMVAAGTTVDVLVEIDVGLRRCGVEPGPDAVRLARRVADAPNLRFVGLQAYHGRAQHVRRYEDRQASARAAADLTRRTLDLLADAGLQAPVVTGGGTGTYLFDAASGVYNELQPGSYVFMDVDYGLNLDRDDEPVSFFEQSLFVLTTVMSRAMPDRAVVDAGLKSHSVDSGMPRVHGVAGARFTRASDEHGVIELDDPGALSLGEKITLVPGHCDPTVNMHDWLVCVRDNQVEDLWPIAARGASR
jgi:3-hydroxy-D-aspartate aldolase